MILVELDSRARADGRTSSDATRALSSGQSESSSASSTGRVMGGWFAIWDAYRRCLRKRNVDVDVPRRLHKLLASSGDFENIVSEEISVPIGFFPKGTEHAQNLFSFVPSLLRTEATCSSLRA